VKLKISIALNVALLAVVAVLLVREKLREIDRVVMAHYVAQKKSEVFEAPSLPQKFDYRIHDRIVLDWSHQGATLRSKRKEPNQPTDPTR
jgi:hypothetical protein